MEYQIVCRICNQLINIEIITQHNDTCKANAEFRRKLLQLNLQVARVCEKAYNMKHKIHLKGQKYLNSFKLKGGELKQEYSYEVYQQYKTLQLLISYGEKTLNSEMDTKYHLITQNELMAVSTSLENRHVLNLVEQINKLINQRLDLCYKTKLLGLPSISFRLSKFSKDSPKSRSDSFNKINSFSDYLSSSNFSEDSQSDKKSFSRPETPGIKQVSIIKNLKKKGKVSIFVKRQASQNWEEDEQNSPQQKKIQSIKAKSYFAKTGSSDNEFEIDCDQIDNNNNNKQQINKINEEQCIEQACFFALQRGYFSDTEMIRLDIENKILERNIGLKDFQFIKQIGQGAYGSVFQVKRIATEDHYAMKIINCCNKSFDRLLNQLKQERNIFEILTGDYVVKAYFSFQHQSSLCFVQELMIGGDFSKILLNEGAFDENIARHYFSEILLALEYLHNNNIIHRDLKPENILLDYNGHIKLADFGLSELGINKKMVKKLSQSPFPCSDLSPSPIYEMKKGRSFRKSNIICENQERKIIGTPDYIAPEIIRGQSFSQKSQDFWSLGIILFEFLVGIPPFNDESVEKIYENILNELIEWPQIGDDPEEQISEQAYDLLKKLLNPDYTQRLGYNSIDEIKKHPFLQSVDWNKLRNKPGPIKPIITQNSQQFDNIQEKVQKFLKRGERKHIQIVRKLQEELEYLERIDLLVATNEQQAQLIKQKLQLL